MRRIFKLLSVVHWLYSVLYFLVLLIALDVAAAIVSAAIGHHTWNAVNIFVIGAMYVLAGASMLIMLYLHLLEDRQVFKRSRQSSS